MSGFERRACRHCLFPICWDEAFIWPMWVHMHDGSSICWAGNDVYAAEPVE